MFPLFGEFVNDGIGKCFPAFALMRCSLMRTYGKCGIEQQHPLLRPTGEVAARWNGDAEVALYLFEDVLQRRGKRNAVVHREAKPVSLTGFVVGVLSENDYLYLLERAAVECGENLFTRRINGVCGILLVYEPGELFEVTLVEFGLQPLFPTFFYTDIHNFLKTFLSLSLCKATNNSYFCHSIRG